MGLNHAPVVGIHFHTKKHGRTFKAIAEKYCWIDSVCKVCNVLVCVKLKKSGRQKLLDSHLVLIWLLKIRLDLCLFK